MESGCGRIQFAMVDAFTNERFRGNPAAVCFVSPDADESWMQLVAAEFNVSQTAFLVKNDSGGETGYDYKLRWFTPTVEVALCGHGTLASAYYLFVMGLMEGDLIRFHTKSGVLVARKTQDLKGGGLQVELIFPLMAVDSFDGFRRSSLAQTLGNQPVVSVSMTGRGDLVLELSSKQMVEELLPNLPEIMSYCDHGLIVTAKDDDAFSGFDFVSRFFAPKMGINEDPVCGSAHCALAPYWAKKLAKDKLCGYQASKRGGKLELELDWQRNGVLIRGEAVITMTGFLLSN